MNIHAGPTQDQNEVPDLEMTLTPDFLFQDFENDLGGTTSDYPTNHAWSEDITDVYEGQDTMVSSMGSGVFQEPHLNQSKTFGGPLDYSSQAGYIVPENLSIAQTDSSESSRIHPIDAYSGVPPGVAAAMRPQEPSEEECDNPILSLSPGFDPPSMAQTGPGYTNLVRWNHVDYAHPASPSGRYHLQMGDIVNPQLSQRVVHDLSNSPFHSSTPASSYPGYSMSFPGISPTEKQSTIPRRALSDSKVNLDANNHVQTQPKGLQTKRKKTIEDGEMLLNVPSPASSHGLTHGSPTSSIEFVGESVPAASKRKRILTEEGKVHAAKVRKSKACGECRTRKVKVRYSGKEVRVFS